MTAGVHTTTIPALLLLLLGLQLVVVDGVAGSLSMQLC
jgi:hypothetical protein